MSQPLATQPPQAHAFCAVHRDVASEAVCERCGNFLCAACRVRQSPARCAGCEARSQDPLGILSAPYSLRNTLMNGAQLYWRTLPVVALTAVVFALPYTLFERMLAQTRNLTEMQLLRMNMAYDSFIGIVGVLICYSVMISHAEGQRWSAGEILARSVRLWPRLFGTNIRVGLWLIAGVVLLLVPAFALMLKYLVTTAVVARGMREDALEHSATLTQGRRWPLMGMLCVLAAIILLPLVGTSLPSLLLVGDEEEVPLSLALVESWLAHVVLAFADAALLATFYGLTRSANLSLSAPEAERT